MLTITARRYDTGEPVRISVQADRIRSVEPAWPDSPVDNWPYVAPGLFDLQINGYGGTWFSTQGITAEQVVAALQPHFRFGITRLCPTLITNSFEALADGFCAIREACERHDWVERMVAGCHLEGPYISKEDGPRGAHPLAHVRPADWDEFCRWQEISGGRIRLVTLAPEVAGAIEFIRKAVEAGIVVAIGHTAAEPEQIAAAVDAGARLSTHLGNAAHGTIRRHPNYIWEQLGQPRLWASIITDGHHLPASVVRSIIGVKTTRKTIITCDAAGLAGCPPGIYDEGDVKVEVLEDGRLVIAGQRQLLAGSGVQTDICVSEAISMAGLALGDAIEMASGNPARLLGLEEVRLQRGAPADLIVFRYAGPGSRLQILATVAAGQVRFGTIPEPPTRTAAGGTSLASPGEFG